MNDEKSSRLRRAFCSCAGKGRNSGYEDFGGVFQRGERKDCGLGKTVKKLEPYVKGAEIVDARLMNGAGEREMKDWVSH